MFKIQTELLVILDLSQKRKTNKCANFTNNCVIDKCQWWLVSCLHWFSNHDHVTLL